MSAQHETYVTSGQCTWRGRSERRYRFGVYDLDTPTLELDGVFIFAGPGNLFTPFTPIFIGEAENFADHIEFCPERAAAIALGANTLHLYYCNPANPDRLRIWQDMIARYAPPLNRARAGFPPVMERQCGEVIPFPTQTCSRVSLRG